MGYNKASSCWPKDLKSLIQDCWADDMRHRPTMSNVVQRLDMCLVEMIEDKSNYSDHSVDSAVCVCNGIGRGKKKGLLSSVRANFPSAA